MSKPLPLFGDDPEKGFEFKPLEAFSLPELKLQPLKVPRPQNVADTSIKSWQELLPQLPKHLAFILGELLDCAAARAHLAGRLMTLPTSSELLEFVEARHTGRDFDVNSVRPALSELKDMGLVEWAEAEGEKPRECMCRRCGRRARRKTAHTWRPLVVR